MLQLLLIIIYYQTIFNGQCLIKNNLSIPEKVINLYISYTLGPQLRNSNTDFRLSNCLFGSVNLTKNADLDKYRYTGYCIGYDSPSEFLFRDGSNGKNVINFGADMSLSVYVDNEGKYILILGEGRAQVVGDTIDFTQSGKIFVLSLHCNGSNSFIVF